MTVSVHEILVRARSRLKDKNNWCQGSSAITERGTSIPFNACEAVKWCARGAILKECSLESATINNVAIRALSSSCKSLRNCDILYANDILGHKAIIEAFDHAIKEERKKSC